MELQLFEDMEYEGQSDWKPVFDPHAFAGQHEELKIDDFKLDDKTLREKAQLVDKIRKKIMAKVESMKLITKEPDENESLDRSRKGIKHSTRATNPEELSERELKSMLMKEQIPGGKYKKRNLKKLSLEDHIGIIEASLVQFKS